jgi:capsid protein
LNLAVLAGELPFQDFELRPERYDSPKWLARGWSWVDPLKEVKAYREAEQAGYLTKAQIIAQSGGGDFDDNLAEIARERKAAKDSGVILDMDLFSGLSSSGEAIVADAVAPEGAPEPPAEQP